MPKRFGSNQLCKFLEQHNFTPQKKKASSHLKYKPPPSFNISPNAKFPFVTVVLRTAYDPVTCNSIRGQLVKLGFSEEEVDKYLG